MYNRVIPRDLFNESKLLKCLGQLAILIHDGIDHAGRRTPGKIKLIHNGDPFVIEQRQEDGGLYCSNIHFLAKNTKLDVYTAYNCKESYPLLVMTEDFVEIEVFNEDGTFSDEFLEFIEGTC